MGCNDMSRTKKVLIAVAIVIPLITVGGGCWLVVYGFSQRPPTEEEKKVLVTASDLEAVGITGLNPADCGSYLVRRELDGSLCIEFSHDPRRDPNRKQRVHVISRVTINRSVESAADAFPYVVKGVVGGVRLAGDNQVVDIKEKLPIGEDQYLGSFRSGGKEAGTLVVLRKGRVIHMFLISGTTIDSKTVTKLLKPTLQQASSKY
jgi:hypothetical protein